MTPGHPGEDRVGREWPERDGRQPVFDSEQSARGSAFRQRPAEWSGRPPSGASWGGLPGSDAPWSPLATSSDPGPEAPPPWEEEEDHFIYDPADWDTVLTPSLPVTPLDAPTAKLPVMPLAPGESVWGRGISAPRRIPGTPGGPGAPGMPGGPGSSGAHRPTTGWPGDVAVDPQPSARLRALRPGNLARATAIVSVAILLSRVLGLFRNSLFAFAFGVGYYSDSFTYAFVVPDAIFNIVAGGALASAFIPVFTDYMITRRDRKTAWHVASSAFNLTTVLMVVIAGLCIVFADPLVRLTVPTLFAAKPGATPEGPEVVVLTRIMLLQPIFLGVSVLTTAVLQARQRFVLPAVGQVIYTVSLIAGILATIADRQLHLFGGTLTGANAIMGPTWGVVAGAIAQFVIQIPGLVAARMHYRLSFDLFHPGVREMFRMMGPRIFNSSMNYVSIFINRTFLGALSATVATGIGYGYLTAFTLLNLPLALFSGAVAQAAFPTLAAFVSDGEWDRLRATVTNTLRGIIYLAIPSSLGLAVLATPIVQLLFRHGHFSETDVPYVAVPLLYFAIGLVGLSMDEILVRTFYALHDSRTPVYVNIGNLIFVVVLSYVLLGPMGAGGLALAFALGALLEAPVLLYLLSPRIGGLDLRELGIFILNVLAASLITALAALLVYYGLTYLVLPDTTGQVRETVYLTIRLGAAIGVAIAVYLSLSRFLGTDDAFPLARLLARIPGLRRLGS
ncbi:MAG TPA: murein biosynthesis integral membrane protein MurJ [Ktedonobacterales bacterium]